MSKQRTETKSVRKRERKKRSCRFTLQHRDALMVALGYAGVYGSHAEDVVKQLRCLAKTGIEIAAGKKGGALAIYRVSWARSLMRKSTEFLDALESSDEKFDEDLHYGIGQCLSGSGKKRSSDLRDEGSTMVAAAVEMAEHVDFGAEYAFEQAVEQVFDGGTKYDKALRDLCRAVHDCWQAATSRPLPTACLLWRNECWENSAAGVGNPLWIVLDSVGINVRQSAVNCLVAYANGEPVSTVKLR
jgi:hypothetical protein